MRRNNEPIRIATAVELDTNVNLTLEFKGRATNTTDAQEFTRKIATFLGLPLKARAPPECHALVDQLVGTATTALASLAHKENPADDGTKRAFMKVRFSCPLTDVAILSLALGIPRGRALNQLTLDLPELGLLSLNAYWDSDEFTQDIQITGNFAHIKYTLEDWRPIVERHLLPGCTIVTMAYLTVPRTTEDGKRSCVEFKDSINLTITFKNPSLMVTREQSTQFVFPLAPRLDDVGGPRTTKLFTKVAPLQVGPPKTWAVPPTIPQAHIFPPANPPLTPAAPAVPAAPAAAAPIPGAPAGAAAAAGDGPNIAPPVNPVPVLDPPTEAARELALQEARDRHSQELAEQAATAAAKTAQDALAREAHERDAATLTREREQAARDAVEEKDRILKMQQKLAASHLKQAQIDAAMLAQQEKEAEERLISTAIAEANLERDRMSSPVPSSDAPPAAATTVLPGNTSEDDGMAEDLKESKAGKDDKADKDATDDEMTADPDLLGRATRSKKAQSKAPSTGAAPPGPTKTATKVRNPTPKRFTTPQPARNPPPGVQTTALAPKTVPTLPPGAPAASGGADAS